VNPICKSGSSQGKSLSLRQMSTKSSSLAILLTLLNEIKAERQNSVNKIQLLSDFADIIERNQG